MFAPGVLTFRTLAVNAGTLHPLGAVSSLSGPRLDELKQLFDVNFFSLVAILAHAIPHLRTRDGKDGLAEGEPAGRVILVSSGAATGGTTGWAAYKCVQVHHLLAVESATSSRAI